MTFLCDMIYYITVFLFGVAVSICFAGISMNRRNILSTLIFCALDGLLQIIIFSSLGKFSTQQLYPLITHLPLILFILLVHKCSLLNSVVSVLTAYLCCQIPRWCGYFFNLFSDNPILYTLFYVLTTLITFYFLYRHIAEPAQQFMKQTRKNALLLGMVPLCYYFFDYISTVYTDWLYSGNAIVVQFMPSLCCFFYVVFIIYYYRELASQAQAEHLAESLHLQLEHASMTLDNMRTMQTQTITYRHDMRHHFSYLQALADSNDIEKIKAYIQSIQADIDTITPKKYCQNELINLVLSTYDAKAEKRNISLNVQSAVPRDLPIADTRLCAILSNALENALLATEKETKKSIQVRLAVRNASLLIQISNPFSGAITYSNNIPSTTSDNHGFGTKSIANIVDSYQGQYEFLAENQMFTVRILLPLSEEIC